MQVKRDIIGIITVILVSVFIFATPVAAENVIRVNGIRLDNTELTIALGNQEWLNATVYPLNAAVRNVEWRNSNPDVVEIDQDGDLRHEVIVKGIKPGETVLTAITTDGRYRIHCLVTVIRPVRSIEIDHDEIYLYPGDEVQLQASVFPRDASETGITWESSSPGIASVDAEGNVKALHVGETRIIARSLENPMINIYTTVIVNPPVTVIDDQDEPVPPEEDDNNLLLLYIVIGILGLLLVVSIIYIVLQGRHRSKTAHLTPTPSPAGQIGRPLLIGSSGMFAGQNFDFTYGRITIGRDPAVSQVVYPDNMEEISRRHCSVYYDQGLQQFILEDFSSNGTFLEDGSKLEHSQQYYLKPGDSFSLAESGEAFIVELE